MVDMTYVGYWVWLTLHVIKGVLNVDVDGWRETDKIKYMFMNGEEEEDQRKDGLRGELKEIEEIALRLTRESGRK